MKTVRDWFLFSIFL